MGETEANWDPMSEAYASPDFNLYNQKFHSRHSGEENLCLFVSGFPSTVTQVGQEIPKIMPLVNCGWESVSTMLVGLHLCAWHAVRNLLSEAGQINYVKTVPDNKRWNCIIAYVYAATYKDALAIIGGFNNFSFLNSTLRVGFTTRKKPLTDPASQSNTGSVVESRGSLSGLNQTLSDVESLGARLGKADVMDFQRLGPQQSQQKPPMGRSKLLMSLTSDAVKTTVGHGAGMKNCSQSLADAASCSTLTDEMDAAAAAGCEIIEEEEVREQLLQNKYCEQLKELSSSAVGRKDEEDKTKTRGLQLVSSSGLIQNGHQMDNASASSHSSISSAKKCQEICAFCQTPGQLFCSVCKTTYCSHSCQRNDWPHHKTVCQSKPSKSDSFLNIPNFDNEFAVGVDVEALSSSVEINMPDGQKFAAASANMKLMESSLPIDAFTEVVLATVPVSPSEIWVVEQKNSKLLDNIKKSLAKRYSGRQNAQRSTAQLMLNDYCVSLFSVDSCWYRTRIESVNRDGTFDVRYIDYGNMETVPLSRIDVLEEEFCSAPSLAVHCRLADLVPADGSGVWSKRALKLCLELLPVLQNYKVKCIQKTANVHSIVLVNSDGRPISDEFIEAGVAKHLSTSTKSSLDQSNSENMQEERISPATSKEDQPGFSLSPLPLSPSGSEVVKELVASSPHGMPTAAKHLFRGTKVLVKVLNIVSPTQFWVHLLSGSSDLEKLPELEASMKQHYEKKPSKKGFSLTVRMLYAAKCSRSDRWLRVHVLNFDRSGVDAFLLDYGICQAMSLVSLVSLEGQFCSLPFQAVHSTLAGIRPKAGAKAWTQGTVDYLQRLISETKNAQHLEAAVCQVDGSCVHLELMLPSGVTVNDLLVKYGMAEFIPDLQPGFFVLSRNLISSGNMVSEGKTSRISPLNLQVSPADQSTGERVEGLLKKLETPPVHLSTSSAAPKLKDLMRNPLVKDTIHEVIVTDATHFFGFYVQVVTVEKATMLQSLEERLNEIYSDYSGSFRPCVGDIVAARFSVDQKWYRGLVREVTSPDSALVMFLDYGNCDDVAVKFISPLDASLLNFPVFAYRCTLQEPTGVVFVQPWNPDFLLPLSATFRMKVLKEMENVHVVDLFSKDHNISWKDKLLRDGVIQLKLASPNDPSKSGSLSTSASQSISSSLGDKVFSSVAGNRSKFEVGSAIIIVHINSVTDFYVHVEDNSLEKAFHGLMQRLKDECGKCTMSSYVPKGPGEVVAALYDRIWYRAKVLQVMSSTTCRMEFVDFGNVDVVACSHLRPLPLGCQLDVLSEMAVPCCLFNLSTSPKGGSGDCQDAESSKWFRNLCLEKRFTVTGVCDVVSNRYAIDLKSTEMTGTVRDCYLKMSGGHKVSPLAENVAAGKTKFPAAQSVGSLSGGQQPRTPLAPFTHRPSDKRVHFANDVKFLPRAQSGGNQLRPTGGIQSLFRSPTSNQSEFRSPGSSNQSGHRPTGSNQSGHRPTGYNQSGHRPTGYNQSGHRPAGGNWPGRGPNVINGTPHRPLRPQFTENRQPDLNAREDNHSGSKVTESHPVITEKKHSGSEVSENNNLGPKITENNESGSKATAGNHLAPKVTEVNHPCPRVNENESGQSDNNGLQSLSSVKSNENNVSKIDTEEKSGNPAVSTMRGQTTENLAEINVKQQPLKKIPAVQKLPETGTLVCIVHANTPSDFSVQTCNDPRMRDLLEQLDRDCGSADLVAHQPKVVGELVAALFEGLWYRAEVIEILSGGEVRLLFVDFGNTDVVKVRDVRALREEYQENLIPRQAVRCCLRMADGFSGDWSPEVVQWFKLNCEASSFVVSSIQTQSSDGVCLIDLKTPESRESLSDKLLMQQSSATKGPLLPHGKAVAVEGSDHAADDRSCVVAEAEKSNHSQASERPDELVASKSRPCQRLPVVGQSVCVVHVNSPSDFYVQLFDDESKDQMAKFLAEFHQSALALNATPYSNGRVGYIVAGLFDNCWFRAEVLELLPGDKARLFFVDYGNVSVVEYRNIRSTMPKDLLSRPWLAVHCAVEGLVGNETNGEWHEDAIAWFRQRFENDICTVKAVVPFEGNQPCVVDLVGSQGKESVKEQIISNRFGQSVSPKQAEKTIRLETELNSTLAIPANNADGKVLGKVVKVEQVADLPQKDILSHAPVTCDANVKVIYANNPSEFFVQLADETVQMSIAQLCLDLTTHCSNSTHDSYRPYAVGECVAGLFEGMWFRAQVLKIMPQDKFELFFVDFGNVDIIGASNIRVLPAKFFSVMPKQAISCGLLRLAGTDVAGKWSHDSCVWFKAYCENFDFRVQAVTLDECGKCLIDMVRKGDQHSIREQLLSSSQAVDLTNEAKLLYDSDRDRYKEMNTVTTSLSSDVNAKCIIADNVSQARLISAGEKHQGGTSATVIPDQAETQLTTVVTTAKPMHDTNKRDLHSVAQELSGNLLTSVTGQPTLAVTQPTASASIATPAANLVSSASTQPAAVASTALSLTNQPAASTDLIKAPVIDTESSVDPPKMTAVKPGSFTINCGDVVTIVHVNSPSDFYVQLQTDSFKREFVELLKELNEWCTSPASGAKPYCPTGVGEIVAANFEGIWYRAEVLDICKDSKFRLRFIDYGNVDVTDFVDIRCLPVVLINALPRQAMPCAISGVMPVEPDGCWSPEAVGWFRENTENVSSFLVRSSSLTHEGKYSVNVCTVSPNGNQEPSLCEMLISMKFGRISETRNNQSNFMLDIKSNGQSNDQSVVAQSSTQSTAQSNDQSSSQSSSQSVITQPTAESSARSSGQSTGQLSDETVPKDSVGDRIHQSTGCSRSVFKFGDLPQLQLSSDVTVEVTLPTNPGSFWCQDLLQMADMVQRFQFQESPPSASASSCPKVVTEKNEVFLGFHDKYGEWYRVVVKDVMEDCLTVRFMDYGDEATLPFDHVRPLPAELMSFPPLAFHCSLAGITAGGSGWTEQAKAVFQSLVTSQILTAFIQSHDSKTDDYKVILKVQSSGHLVGDELVTAGLANRV